MQSKAQWFRALTERLGVHGAAERLDMPVTSVRRTLETETGALRPALAAAVSRLMALNPDIVKEPAAVAYTDPRHEKTIPIRPYPDEVNFFGRAMAFKTSRWRYLTALSQHLEDTEPKSTRSLLVKKDLLNLEIQLMKDDGMALASTQKHSQAVHSSTIRLREQWEWRERELADVEADLETEGGTIEEDNPIRSTLALFRK